MSVSVLIVTKNEEHDISDCIKSVSWSDDIVVCDSFSSDRTVDIAGSLGASVVMRPGQDPSLPFGGDESAHRNWSIHQVDFRYEWLFVIDADERVTPEASNEMINISLEAECICSAYRIRRHDYFMGRHLRYVQASPWYIRFFKPSFVSYRRMINPVVDVNGPVLDICSPLLHFPFSKGVSHWVSRHNSYSTYEARQIALNRMNFEKFSLASVFLERDFNRRRYHQKELFYRLPARPLLKFFLLYVFKLGFLDGFPGLAYVILQCFYEFLIVLKVKELRGLALEMKSHSLR
jgi:glycosyltransferase involved in cell wall biosynthesis